MLDQTSRPDRGNPFFSDLPSFDDFDSVFDRTQYTPAPEGWLVVIADIQGSTAAITNGRYKDVNMVGAASIAAVLNVTRVHEVPYAFGGDGATFIVPDETLPRVREALLKTSHLSQSSFDLKLRVGAVPLANIRKSGVDVLVAKHRLSPGNYLAMFAGGGVSLADKMIKDDDGSEGYLFDHDTPNVSPNLEGLSCRWEPLNSLRGDMVSILVQVLPGKDRDLAATHRKIIAGITEALGSDLQKNQPIVAENMRFRWPPAGLKTEAKLTRGERGYKRWLLKLYLESFVQLVLEKFKLKFIGYHPPTYHPELRRNSDYRRFDDMLRMVLDCTTEEAAALERVLAAFRAEGLIVYGLHHAKSALMTCLVFNLYESEHIHFIDGADGGYALAARQLKEQLADLPQTEPGLLATG